MAEWRTAMALLRSSRAARAGPLAMPKGPWRWSVQLLWQKDQKGKGLGGLGAFNRCLRSLDSAPNQALRLLSQMRRMELQAERWIHVYESIESMVLHKGVLSWFYHGFPTVIAWFDLFFLMVMRPDLKTTSPRSRTLHPGAPRSIACGAAGAGPSGS